MHPLPARPRIQAGGFTLTELLITLVILGLLAAFGLPALFKYGLQSREASTQAALRRIAHRQSQWFAAHHAYASLNQLGYPVDTSLAAIYLDKDGAASGNANRESIYRITLRLRAASAGNDEAYYLITAEPINDQVSDTRCGTLSLASTGQVGATGTLGEAGCWQK
jgi:type IV pilus assembly protein PilE